MPDVEHWEVMDDGDSEGGDWEVIEDDEHALRVPTGAAVASSPASPTVARVTASSSSVPPVKPATTPTAKPATTPATTPAAKPAARSLPKGVPGERRVNPENGRQYTFEEISTAYGKDFTEAELAAFWQDEMRPPGSDQSRAADILRSMGMGDGGLGTDGASGMAAFPGGLPGGVGADLGGGGFNPTPIPNMTDTTGSLAGLGKPGPAPRPAERWKTLPVDSHERRLDPDDGLPRSFEDLSGKFWKLCEEDWDRYVEDDVRRHWFEKCKPDPNERRRLPDEDGGSDSKTFSIAELKAAFPDYTADDFAAYWRDACFPVAPATEGPS